MGSYDPETERYNAQQEDMDALLSKVDKIIELLEILADKGQ